MIREYRTIREITGPLMVVENVKGVSYNEFAEIVLPGGEVRHCKVLDVCRDTAVVQVFENTAGINPAVSRVRFLGHPPKLAVSDDMLGRVFNAMGKPIDGGPDILPKANKDISGTPVNPAAREMPNEFIQTGISSIDGLNPIVRGQTVTIFSRPELPHAQLAAQIARQAEVRGGERFAVVFCSIGVTFEESEYFIQEFNRTGAIDRSVVFTNLASDPVTERIAAPRIALTAAEYLAFEKDMHVLVILTDISNYAGALREVSAARKEIPGRRGYPSYLHTDLSTIFERAGRRAGKPGSITLLTILTSPDGDVTHPVSDTLGYIAEGQIFLSRALHSGGITPPVDLSFSQSRLKYSAIGDGKTREDHIDTMNQLNAAYFSGKTASGLLSIFGVDAMTESDIQYAKFFDEFESRYISQGFYENRSIEDTLSLGWELMSILPKNGLNRINPELIAKYLPNT